MKAMQALEKIAQKKEAGVTSRAKIIPGKVHISFSMSGKLYQIAAISTAVHMNPVCRARIAAGNSVCTYCFAAATMNQYAETREHMEENFRTLTTKELTDNEIQELVYQVRWNGRTELRIEAFGDVANSIQASNYIRIANAMNAAGIKVGLWTKNPNLYKKAIEKYGKPEATTFILSSCGLNLIDVNIASKYDFIDRTFTVYDDKQAARQAIADGAIECKCDKGSCHLSCNRCYRGETRKDGGLLNIVEILRK